MTKWDANSSPALDRSSDLHCEPLRMRVCVFLPEACAITQVASKDKGEGEEACLPFSADKQRPPVLSLLFYHCPV